jgi:hypothetical protein
MLEIVALGTDAPARTAAINSELGDLLRAELANKCSAEVPFV